MSGLVPIASARSLRALAVKALSAGLLCVDLLLSGCVVGPRPPPPASAAPTPPPDWRQGPSSGVAVRADWWTDFHDPALTALVQAALADNSDIAVAVARVQETRAQERQARALLSPTLDLGVPGARSRDLNAFGQSTEQTAAKPQLQAAYDLDLFGRLAAGDAAARASLLASQAGADTMRLAVASAAASGYITLRGLDARLVVARETIAEREAALRVARRRAESGYTSMLELRQAEAEYRAAQQLAPQVLLAIARQENALNVLIGRPGGSIERGAKLEDLVASLPDSGVPAQILRQRPDIRQAEQQLVAADHSLDAVRAAFLPDVRLGASAGAVASTLLSDPLTVWSVGGSVLAPIFEGGRLNAQADAAAARRDQAAFGYRKTALTAFREVEDALAGARQTQAQLDYLQGQQSALRQALRLASNRYDAGYAPYLDQLDAQRGLLGADLGVVQARTDHLLATVALCQALGGGWTP